MTTVLPSQAGSSRTFFAKAEHSVAVWGVRICSFRCFAKGSSVSTGRLLWLRESGRAANNATGSPFAVSVGVLVRNWTSAWARSLPVAERWTLDSFGGFSAWRRRMISPGRASTDWTPASTMQIVETATVPELRLRRLLFRSISTLAFLSALFDPFRGNVTPCGYINLAFRFDAPVASLVEPELSDKTRRF